MWLSRVEYSARVEEISIKRKNSGWYYYFDALPVPGIAPIKISIKKKVQTGCFIDRVFAMKQRCNGQKI